jgi:hypothetical protein
MCDSSTTFSIANGTFQNANLSYLSTLSLKDSIFAREEMIKSMDGGNIAIANNIFEKADLSNLNILDMSNAVFATSNMTNAAGVLNSSFANSTLSKLNYLYLPTQYPINRG